MYVLVAGGDGGDVRCCVAVLVCMVMVVVLGRGGSGGSSGGDVGWRVCRWCCRLDFHRFLGSSRVPPRGETFRNWGMSWGSFSKTAGVDAGCRAGGVGRCA